jgi:predicted ATPase
MLETLTLENMGLAPELKFEFGPRLNIITGDNGVGKTFVLDSAWFALTRTWAGDRDIIPHPGSGKASINYHVHGKGGPNNFVTCDFYRKEQRWKLPHRRPPMPGLIIYARVDGSFSVWDPSRNYWRTGNEPDDAVSESRHQKSRPDKFDFDGQSLWEGLRLPDGTVVCRGLIEDWETWRLKGNGDFRLLERVLECLSPNENERLLPGTSRKVSILDSREVPTLRLPYGEVPITQISAGMRRILSFAYILVWAWSEHKRAAQLTGDTIAQRVIVLLDEVEAHLHPQWQRRLLPAVLEAVQNILLSNDDITVQAIVTTHAPLVLASIETHFKPATDKLFNLQVTHQQQVELEDIPWAKQGDVISWLTSGMFDLGSGYSTEAERAMKAADEFMAGLVNRLPPDLRTREAIEAELKRTLPGDDPYWVYWIGSKNPSASVTRS